MSMEGEGCVLTRATGGLVQCTLIPSGVTPMGQIEASGTASP